MSYVFGIKLFLFLNFTDTILQYTELPAICFAIDHVFNFLAKKFLSVSNKATKQCWGQIYSSPALLFRKKHCLWETILLFSTEVNGIL